MDMAEISTTDTPTMTDVAAIPRIPYTATSGEDIATSESRFAITSENFDKQSPCPLTIPHNHINPIPESDTSLLEEKTITAGRSDHVIFENNQSSISSQMCNATSGGADVQNWESSASSKDITLNADSTASVNISGKEYNPSISSEDDTTSPNKGTVSVFENITTIAGDPSTAPIDIATNEDNVAAASGVNLISTIVLGDATNSEEAIPDPGDISNISSGEKIAGSTDAFSAVSTGDTTITAPSLGSILVFVDTSDTQAISSPKDHPTTAGDITTAPGDFTADPVSDSGDISHITLKEASPSLLGDATVLLQGGTAGAFTTDTSGIIPTFSATTEYITSDQNLPVISGSTSNLVCSDSNTAVEGTHVTRGPKGSFTNGNKTNTISREAEASITAVPTTTPGDAREASTDGLNVSSKTTKSVPLKTTKCPITTDSGDTSVITRMNATAFGNITATHIDSAIPGNDTGMIHRENNSPILDDASIIFASGETFIVSQDTTVNIATTISSQNASEHSARPQAGQCSETKTRKTSTVLGSFTNIHRDTDTVEVNLTSPANTVTTVAAITSTTTTLENGNTATSRIPTSTSQNINDMIFEEVTASTLSKDGTECLTSRNTATIYFENAGTTVATSVSLGESESTNTTSSPPRETTCSTGNDTMKTSSGSTLNFCVPASAPGELPATVPKETPVSIGKPILEFTSIHGEALNETVSLDSASASNIVQDRKLSVATTSDDSKSPTHAPMVVPRDITSATKIPLLSRELSTSVLEDAANNKFDSASISATSSRDTSEDEHCEGRITSGHCGTETVLGCVSTPDSSIRTHFQEASKGPGDTTTLLGYTTNILEGAQICHDEFASVNSKIPTVLVQTPKVNDAASILGAYISAEATRQSESAPTKNTASPSVDNEIQSENLNTPVTIGTNSITSHKGTEIVNQSLIPDSISTSVISGIFEATPVPQDSRNTTALPDANSAFSAGDAAIITTTKSTGATTAGASGGFMKTTTLLKDTTTFTTTSTGATATVTALKDTVMTTQTSMRDIATDSRNETTTILEGTSTPRKTVTSEKMAVTTLGDIMTQCQVLIAGTRSCGGIPVGNIIPKETLSNDPSDYYLDRITTDSIASANIISILSDTISTPNNASAVLEITTSPEGILASRNNCTITQVQLSTQSQSTIPEDPSSVTEKASFATEETITVMTTSEAGIAHPVPKDTTMTNTPEDETNSSVTFKKSENITSVTPTSVSPREVDAATCMPLDMTISALGKTVPLGQRFCSGNAANTSTSLEEVCACPDCPSPTEASSTVPCTSHSRTRQLVELETPCLSTISISEFSSKISETSTGFEDAITPVLFLQGTGQSIATGDTTTSVTTPDIVAFAEPKSLAPGDAHTLVRTTFDGPTESVATSTPEHIPTPFGATDMYTGGKATGADVAKYTIATTIVSEEAITAPGDNITDLAIPRDKNTVPDVVSIHARTLTACGDAGGDTTSGATTCKVDASLIPTCTAMISLRETLTPGASPASKDTGILAASDVVGRTQMLLGELPATTVTSGKYPSPEMTMIMEETALFGIITTTSETFVPQITTSFTEALIPRSATELSLASSSEATIFSAETSTDGPTFSSGPASRNASFHKNIVDEDLIVVTTSSSTSSKPFHVGRKTLIFEDAACSASGHPYTPENKAFTPENVATTVAEDTTIVSGNTSTVSEGPVVIILGKDTDSPTTIEGVLIVATGTPRDTIDTTVTESSVVTPRRTTVVPGESPTIYPVEKTYDTYTATETAMITGGTGNEAGEILTATPRETSIATFGKAMDSPTRDTFVAPGETLIISPREAHAAPSGEITGATCTSTSQRSDTSHEDASTIPKETDADIPRETAPVKPGKAAESTTRETTTILHRKIPPAVPRKIFTIASSPGEIPTTALTEATHEASPFSVRSNNTATGVTPEDTSMAALSKTASASHEKNRTVTPLPYWSIMLIGIMVILFLLAGFCLVIYYVTVFILVAYSASLSSNTFS